MNELANNTMDAIQDFHEERQSMFNRNGVRKIYGHTHANSKLRTSATLEYLEFLYLTGSEGDIGKELTEIARDMPVFGADYIEL